jgi:hypothetical protein
MQELLMEMWYGRETGDVKGDTWCVEACYLIFLPTICYYLLDKQEKLWYNIRCKNKTWR